MVLLLDLEREEEDEVTESAFAIREAEVVRWRMNSSVARVMVKAAEAEQAWMEGSRERILLMRATGRRD